MITSFTALKTFLKFSVLVAQVMKGYTAFFLLLMRSMNLVRMYSEAGSNAFWPATG